MELYIYAALILLLKIWPLLFVYVTTDENSVKEYILVNIW